MSAISSPGDPYAMFESLRHGGVHVTTFATVRALAEVAIRKTAWEFPQPEERVLWLRGVLADVEQEVAQCGIVVPHAAPCTGCHMLSEGRCHAPVMYPDFSCRQVAPSHDEQMALGLPVDPPAQG